MTSPAPPIPDPRRHPTLSVVEAGRLLGLGKTAAYAAVNRGELPTIPLSGSTRVVTARLLAMLGLDPTPQDVHDDE